MGYKDKENLEDYLKILSESKGGPKDGEKLIERSNSGLESDGRVLEEGESDQENKNFDEEKKALETPTTLQTTTDIVD